MTSLLRRGFNRLYARLWANHPHSKDAAGEDMSNRIRARYDTARKKPVQPTRQWMREHGVYDDWTDTWRAVDRW